MHCFEAGFHFDDFFFIIIFATSFASRQIGEVAKYLKSKFEGREKFLKIKKLKQSAQINY